MIDGLDISVGTFSEADKVRKKNQVLIFNVYTILNINNWVLYYAKIIPNILKISKSKIAMVSNFDTILNQILNH